jgi:hypothetical protein
MIIFETDSIAILLANEVSEEVWTARTRS